MRNTFKILTLITLLASVQSVFAQVSIDISGGVVRGKPIAIVPFKTLDGTVPATQIDQVIANDLATSGKFEPISPTNYMSPPSRHEDVRFKDWRFIDAEVLAVSSSMSLGAKAGWGRCAVVDSEQPSKNINNPQCR